MNMNIIAKYAGKIAIQVIAATAISAGTVAGVNLAGEIVDKVNQKKRKKVELTKEEIENNVVSVQHEEKEPEEEGAQ